MFRVSKALRSTHGHVGAIVLDVERGRMFDLNPVASKILELLKSGSCESVIVNTVSTEFNIRRDLVESDVREFILALRDCQFLE